MKAGRFIFIFFVLVSVKEDDIQNIANWIEEKDESTTSEFDRFLGQSPVFLSFNFFPVLRIHPDQDSNIG